MSRFPLISIVILSLAKAQQPAQPVEQPRRDEASFRINSVSTRVTGYSLLYPGVAGANTQDSALWFVASGAAADVAWMYPGRQTRVTLDYQIGYNGNPRFSTLNGFDHALTLAIRREVSRRTTLLFGVTGESRLVSTALFEPSANQRLAQDAISVDEISAGLIGSGALPVSPVDLVLFGARITMASVNAGFTHNQSPKLTWLGNVSLSRVMRGDGANPIVAAQYPAATVGVANLSAQYNLSPRTRVAFGGNYMHSESRRYQFDWEFGNIDLQRTLGRHAFAHVEGGFGRVVDRSPGGQGRNAYTAATGLGALLGDHTIVASFRRGGADYRGTGLATSMGAEASWAWAAPGSRWNFVNNVAYEQLSAANIGNGLSIEAWILRAAVTRRTTLHTRLVCEGAYVNTSSPAPMLLSGGGFQIAFVWTPSFERRRR